MSSPPDNSGGQRGGGGAGSHDGPRASQNNTTEALRSATPGNPAAAVPAASSASTVLLLEKKKKEFEDTLLRLTLCNDDRLPVVLDKLLPVAFREFLQCPPPLIPKIVEILNHCLQRLRGTSSMRLPFTSLVQVWIEAESLNLSSSSSSTVDGEKSKNVSLVRNILLLFLPLAVTRSTLTERLEVAETLLNSFHVFYPISYPAAFLLFCQCVCTPEAISHLTQCQRRTGGKEGLGTKDFLRRFSSILSIDNAPHHLEHLQKKGITGSTSSFEARGEDLCGSQSRSLPCTMTSYVVQSFVQACIEFLLLPPGLGTSPSQSSSAASSSSTSGQQQLQRGKEEEVLNLPGIPDEVGRLWKQRMKFSRQEILSFQSNLISLLTKITKFTPITGVSDGSSLRSSTSSYLPEASSVSSPGGRRQEGSETRLSQHPHPDERGLDSNKTDLLKPSPTTTTATLGQEGSSTTNSHIKDSSSSLSSPPPASSSDSSVNLSPCEEGQVEKTEDSCYVPPLMYVPLLVATSHPHEDISSPASTAVAQLRVLVDMSDPYLLYFLFDLISTSSSSSSSSSLSSFSSSNPPGFLLFDSPYRRYPRTFPSPRLHMKILQELSSTREVASLRYWENVLSVTLEVLHPNFPLLRKKLLLRKVPHTPEDKERGEQSPRSSTSGQDGNRRSEENFSSSTITTTCRPEVKIRALQLLLWCMQQQRWFLPEASKEEKKDHSKETSSAHTKTGLISSPSPSEKKSNNEDLLEGKKDNIENQEEKRDLPIEGRGHADAGEESQNVEKKNEDDLQITTIRNLSSSSLKDNRYRGDSYSRILQTTCSRDVEEGLLRNDDRRKVPLTRECEVRASIVLQSLLSLLYSYLKDIFKKHEREVENFNNIQLNTERRSHEDADDRTSLYGYARRREGDGKTSGQIAIEESLARQTNSDLLLLTLEILATFARVCPAALPSSSSSSTPFSSVSPNQQSSSPGREGHDASEKAKAFLRDRTIEKRDFLRMTKDIEACFFTEESPSYIGPSPFVFIQEGFLHLSILCFELLKSCCIDDTFWGRGDQRASSYSALKGRHAETASLPSLIPSLLQTLGGCSDWIGRRRESEEEEEEKRWTRNSQRSFSPAGRKREGAPKEEEHQLSRQDKEEERQKTTQQLSSFSNEESLPTASPNEERREKDHNRKQTDEDSHQRGTTPHVLSTTKGDDQGEGSTSSSHSNSIILSKRLSENAYASMNKDRRDYKADTWLESFVLCLLDNVVEFLQDRNRKMPSDFSEKKVLFFTRRKEETPTGRGLSSATKESRGNALETERERDDDKYSCEGSLEEMHGGGRRREQSLHNIGNRVFHVIEQEIIRWSTRVFSPYHPAYRFFPLYFSRSIETTTSDLSNASLSQFPDRLPSFSSFLLFSFLRLFPLEWFSSIPATNNRSSSSSSSHIPAGCIASEKDSKEGVSSSFLSCILRAPGPCLPLSHPLWISWISKCRSAFSLLVSFYSQCDMTTSPLLLSSCTPPPPSLRLLLPFCKYLLILLRRVVVVWPLSIKTSSSWRRRIGKGRTGRSSPSSPSPCASTEQERQAFLVRTPEEENGDVHVDEAANHPSKIKRMRYMNQEVGKEQQWSPKGATCSREENREVSSRVVSDLSKKSTDAISPSTNSKKPEGEEEERIEASQFFSVFTGELSLFLMMLYPLLWISPSSSLLGKSKDSHRPSSENELDTGYAVFCLSARCIVRYLTRMSILSHRKDAREENRRGVSCKESFSCSTTSFTNAKLCKDSSESDLRENPDDKEKDKVLSLSSLPSSCRERQFLPSCPSALLIFLGLCMEKIESSLLFADLTPGSTSEGEGSQRGGSTMGREREEIREMASQLIAQIVGFIHKTQGEQQRMHCLHLTMEAKEDNCRLGTPSSFYLVKVLRHFYKYLNVFSSDLIDKNDRSRLPSWKQSNDVQKDIQKRIDSHSLHDSSLRAGGRQDVYFDDDIEQDEDSFPSLEKVLLGRRNHPLYRGGRTEEQKNSEYLVEGRLPSNHMKRKEDFSIPVTSHVDARHLVGSLLAIAHLLSATVFCTPAERTSPSQSSSCSIPCTSPKKKTSETERCSLNKKSLDQKKDADKKTSFSGACCGEEEEEGERMVERKREDFSANCERIEREEITLRCVEMVLEHVFFWGARYCWFSHTSLRGHQKEKEEKKKNFSLHAFFEKDNSKGFSSLKNMKETEVLHWTPELLNASLRALVGICDTQISQLNVLVLVLRRKIETDKEREEKGKKKEEKEMKEGTGLDSTKGDEEQAENKKEMIMEEVGKQGENERKEKKNGREEEEGLWVLVDMLEFVLQQALAIAVDEAGGDLKPLTNSSQRSSVAICNTVWLCIASIGAYSSRCFTQKKKLSIDISGEDGTSLSSSTTTSSFSPLFVRCFSLLLSECKHRSSLLRCGLSLAISKFFAETSPQDGKEILSQIASLALNENKPSSASENKPSSSSTAEEPRQEDPSGGDASASSSSSPSSPSSDKKDGKKEKSLNLILKLSDRCSEIELKGVLASDKQLVTQVSATAGICLCSLLLHVPVHPSMDSTVLCLIQRVFLRMVSHPDVLAGACGWRGLCRVAGAALSSDLFSKRKAAYDSERRKRRKQREHQGEDTTGKELAMEAEEEQEEGLTGKEEMVGEELPENPPLSKEETKTMDHEKSDRSTERNKGDMVAEKEEEYPLFSELLRSLLQAMTVQGRDFQAQHLQMQGFKAPQSSSSGGENKKKEEDDDKGRSRLYGLNLDNEAAVARVRLLRQLLTVARELNNPPLVYVLLDQPHGEQALFLHHRIFIESLDLLKGITTKCSSSSSFSSKSGGTTLSSNMLYDLTALEKYVDEKEDDAEGVDVSFCGEDPCAAGDDSEQDDEEELEDQDGTSLAKHITGQLSEERQQEEKGEGDTWRDAGLKDKTSDRHKTGYYWMPGHAREIWTAEAGRILLELACSETNRATRNVKYALAVYLHHRNAGLRDVALLTCQSVFGFSSLADLLQKSLTDRSEKWSQEKSSTKLLPQRQSEESRTVLQEEKDCGEAGDQEREGEYAMKKEEKNEVWLGLAKSFLLSLQGAEPLRREAACKGGSLLFKWGRQWNDVRDVIEETWRSTVRCMDDLCEEVRVAAGPLSRSVKMMTVGVCTPKFQGEKNAQEAIEKVIPLLQHLCDINSNNKELRLFLLDALKDSLSACGRSVGPSLPLLIPFLIDAIAAYEPRALSHYQFHAEKMLGISSSTFEQLRVNYSLNGPIANLLKSVVRYITPSIFSMLVPVLLQKLRSGVGSSSRCSVCMLITWVITEHCGSSTNVVLSSNISREGGGDGGQEDFVVSSQDAKRLIRGLAKALMDPSPAVPRAGATALACIGRFVNDQELSKLIEAQLLKPLGNELADAEGGDASKRKEVRTGTGRALLEVCKRFSDRLMGTSTRGQIAARAFVLSNSTEVSTESSTSTSSCRGIWGQVWSEISASSDCVAVQRFLCLILKDIQQLLESPWREDRVDAASAVQAVCRLLWPVWYDMGGRRHDPSRERISLEEAEGLCDLHQKMTTTLSMTSAFPGISLIACSLLDLTSLLLTLFEARAAPSFSFLLSSSSSLTKARDGEKGEDKIEEEKAVEAVLAERSEKAISVGFLKTARAKTLNDQAYLVSHLSSYLETVPLPWVERQPMEKFVDLTLEILRRLDPQSRKEGEEGGNEKKEEDKTQKEEGSEGKNVTALNQNNSQDGRGDLVRESHDEGEDGAHTTYQRKTWTVASKDESTLLACLKTLYILIFLDISHRTGRMPTGTRKKDEISWGGGGSKLPCFKELSAYGVEEESKEFRRQVSEHAKRVKENNSEDHSSLLSFFPLPVTLSSFPGLVPAWDIPASQFKPALLPSPTNGACRDTTTEKNEAAPETPDRSLQEKEKLSGLERNREQGEVEDGRQRPADESTSNALTNPRGEDKAHVVDGRKNKRKDTDTHGHKGLHEFLERLQGYPSVSVQLKVGFMGLLRQTLLTLASLRLPFLAVESAAFCWRPLLTFIAKNIEQRKYIRLILGAGEVLDAFCCHYTVLLEEGNLFLECLSRSGKNVILSSSAVKANGDIATLANNTSEAKKNEVEHKGKEEQAREFKREAKEVTADQLVAYDSIKQFYYMDVKLYEEQKFSRRERLWLEKYLRDEEKDGGAPANGDDEDFSVLRSYLETHCRDRNLNQSLVMYPSIWKLFLHLVIAKKGGGENQGDEWKKSDHHGQRGRQEGEDDEERKEDARIEMMKKRLRDKLKSVIDKEEEKERSV
ncbi:heat repeat-containing protein [Cystoisospora suis]|uniref:Heat repeat-containing protein n=1 Tax=Cystoisospora suis TaxID=483139 RepID=A0A2C6KTB4_9APIC|nr:heat repeat-containing protein [Cystoisospora suis]